MFFLILAGAAAYAQEIPDAPVDPPDTAEAPEPDASPDAPSPPGALDVEALRREITHEASTELASIKLGDSDVDLLVSGFWKGTLSANMGVSQSQLGTEAASTDSPILFQQEADLTLSLWIKNRWFVEAGFLDDYDMNTYRAGYQGLPGEAVQYVGIGNTGLDYPVFPYMDMGGNSPSSFGVYGRFGGGDFTVHGLFRYDAAAREERVFVGDRERTYSYVPLDQPLRGRSFVLPDDNLDAVPVVYLEDEDGPLRDQNNRRWRLAVPSEFAASRSSGIVELNITPAGMVAVAYSKGSSKPWESSLGTYVINTMPPPSGTAPTPGPLFLGDVQQWFNMAGTGVSLTNYPMPGDTGPAATSYPPYNGTPGTISLPGGITALVVYDGSNFSPFERLNRYRSPSSAASGASLVQLSTRERVKGYDALPFEETAVSADIPLYATSDARRGIYEIIGENLSRDRRNPATRWPLGNTYPEIYLPGFFAFNGDLGVRFANYGNAGTGAYSIGTDVIPGSVEVYRSGLPDPNITFDPTSGTVRLTSPAGFNEVIRITYLRRSNEKRQGSIAAGVGTVYDPEGPWSSTLALGLRWNVSDESYSEEGATSPGTVGISAGSSWDYDRLKARVTAGFFFEQPDTAGLYRAAGMEGHELGLTMPPDDSFNSQPPNSVSFPSSTFPLFSGLTFDTNNRSSLTYRNYRDTSALGTSTLMQIGWSGASVISGKEGPYPAMDSQLTSQYHILAGEFTLDNSKTWAGFEVPLLDEGDTLERAEEIEIPFRFYGFSSWPQEKQIEAAIQFGSLSGEDNAVTENDNLIVTIPLFVSNATSTLGDDARLVTHNLTVEERRKLKGAKYMRLVIAYNGSTEIRGRVLLAPPIIRGAGWRPIIADGSGISSPDSTTTNSVSAVEWLEPPGSGRLENKYSDILDRLHSISSRQRVLKVNWKGLDLTKYKSAGADSRIPSLPLEDYRTLSFFIRGTDLSEVQDGTLRFVLARGPGFISGEKCLIDAEIPISAFNPAETEANSEWHKVELHYRGDNRRISVDGDTVSGAKLRYRADATGQDASLAGDTAGGRSQYAAVLITPGTSDTGSPGEFYFDEIILEDPSPAYRINGGGRLEYTRPGTLVSFSGQPVLADLSVDTAIESALRGDPFTAADELQAGAVSRSNAGITVLGAKISGNFSFTTARDTWYWSAGHRISRNWGPFGVYGDFSSSPRDITLNHSAGLDLTGPVNFNLKGEAAYEDLRLTRKWTSAAGFTPENKFVPALSLGFDASWTENTETPSSWLDDYALGWAKTWGEMIPDLGEEAARRETGGRIRISERTSPVGADLLFEGSTAFSALNNTTRSTNLVRLDMPVQIGTWNLLFRGERGYKRQLEFSGRNAVDEGAKFGEAIADMLPLWKVFPFYSLFAPELNGAMDEGLSNSPSRDMAEYTSFNDTFAVNVKLPGRYDFFALLVPDSAGLQLDRILEQKLDTRLDLLNLQSTLGFSAINMFGAMGSSPVFRFYSTDEFTHNLALSTAFPRGEDTSWRVQSGINMSFRGFTGAELGAANTLALGSSGWTESVIIDWIVPTKRSLLSIVYDGISRVISTQSSWLSLSDMLETEYEQLRKETLELAFDKTGDYLTWSLIAGHESIIRILGRLNFSVFAKLNCTQNYASEELSFIATIGTTLHVTF